MNFTCPAAGGRLDFRLLRLYALASGGQLARRKNGRVSSAIFACKLCGIKERDDSNIHVSFKADAQQHRKILLWQQNPAL